MADLEKFQNSEPATIGKKLCPPRTEFFPFALAAALARAVGGVA